MFNIVETSHFAQWLAGGDKSTQEKDIARAHAMAKELE